MAIYAQTGCTLSTVIDVEAVYTYYYLSGSTITTNEAPKDGVNPPGASTITVVSEGVDYVWHITEPELDIEDDIIQTAVGKLYYIECVKFSNGTYDWGPLMTSSTYAAAKSAYNLSYQALQSANAASEATALLGGHFIYNSTWQTTNTPHSANVIQTTEKNGVDVSKDPSKWDYNVHIGANGIRLRNNEIVLSEWTSSALSFYNPQASANQNRLQLSIGANGTLQSGNYQRGTGTSYGVFAQSGTKIDLINGEIYSPSFRLTSGTSGDKDPDTSQLLTAGVYIKGKIQAREGSIGLDATNYWEIGNHYSFGQQNSAAIIAHGNYAFIQTGTDNNWRIIKDRIHSGWVGTSSTSLLFPERSSGTEYYDYGIHIPTATKSKFLYIRKGTKSALTDLQTNFDEADSVSSNPWTYLFYVDGNGSVHAQNFYVRDSSTPIGGGTGTVAEKLLTGAGTSTKPVYFRSDSGHVGEVAAVSWDVKTSLNNSNDEVPTSAAVKSFVEGKGYLTSETDPTVPAWAKASTKPSYNFSEINAKPDTISGYGITNAYTKTEVDTLINNLPEPMIFKGSLGTGGTITSLPTATATNEGFMYKVITAGTYASQAAKVGDLFISNGSSWILIPSGDEPSGTVTSVGASGSGGISISGSPITTSGTITIGLNLSTAINGLGEGTSPAQRDDYIVAQYAGGGTTTTTYHRRKLSNIFAALNQSDITAALGYTPYNSTNPNGYTSNTGTVKSVRVQASSPLQSSQSTAQSETLNTTISFANQNKNLVLAGPSTGNAAAPTFRKLVVDDIPGLPWSQITSGKPTTLSGYGITDAADKTAITGLSASSNSSGVTTFTATRASGTDPLSFEVSIVASAATGANALQNSEGLINEGSTTKPVYFEDGIPKAGSTYAGGTAVTLNGTSKASSTASFYAPTSAGTKDYVLVANTSGVPTWVPQSDITSGNTDSYHTSSGWNGLTYSLTGVGNASNISITIPTGTSSTTVLRGDHTYTTTIAKDTTSTNQLTLAYGTKYKITAGGTSYVFTMPSSDNTDTTYTFAEGTTNGAFSVTPKGGSAQSVSIHGLKALAYKDSLSKSDVGLGNVENTALSTWTGTNKITTVGTITTGAWNGTTIDVSHGGTGKTSGRDAANYFLNSLDTGSSTPADNDYYISQYVNGGTTTTTYHRRPMSALWNYISGKISGSGKYVTIDTNQTLAATGIKTYLGLQIYGSNGITLGTTSGNSVTQKVNMKYDSTLDAIVFSFA